MNAPAMPDTVARPAGLRTDTLANSIVMLLALTVVQRLVGFGRAVLFCRWLEPEQLGHWDMAFAFLVMAAPLAILALPGTFGRYLEHYRQRGQLRTLVRRTALGCAALAGPFIGAVILARAWFSQLVFGSRDDTALVLVLAVSLAAVIAHNFMIELSTALRNVRLVSNLQLVNSLAFAALGILLLAYYRCAAVSVVAAYGGACVVSVTMALWRLRGVWRGVPEETEAVPHRAFWAKLVPFAAWVMVINFLGSLFDAADRYMIIHCSTGSAAQALGQVGEYHSSRIVPLLLVSIATMLGTMLVPHLSHDWEAGRRQAVSERLNLFLKMLTLALTAGAAAVLVASPLLFGVAFHGKFAGGQAVLPWTLIYCIWFGMSMVAQTYLWCAEKTRLAGIALVAGLAVNVTLNMLLLPRLGLLGVVLATTAANGVAFALVLLFNRMLGFAIDRGTWVVLAAPLALALGPWITLLVLAAIAMEIVRSEQLLTESQKRSIADSLAGYFTWWTWWRKRAAAE